MMRGRRRWGSFAGMEKICPWGSPLQFCRPCSMSTEALLQRNASVRHGSWQLSIARLFAFTPTCTRASFKSYTPFKVRVDPGQSSQGKSSTHDSETSKRVLHVTVRQIACLEYFAVHGTGYYLVT